MGVASMLKEPNPSLRPSAGIYLPLALGPLRELNPGTIVSQDATTLTTRIVFCQEQDICAQDNYFSALEQSL